MLLCWLFAGYWKPPASYCIFLSSFCRVWPLYKREGERQKDKGSARESERQRERECKRGRIWKKHNCIYYADKSRDTNSSELHVCVCVCLLKRITNAIVYRCVCVCMRLCVCVCVCDSHFVAQHESAAERGGVCWAAQRMLCLFLQINLITKIMPLKIVYTQTKDTAGLPRLPQTAENHCTVAATAAQQQRQLQKAEKFNYQACLLHTARTNRTTHS